MSWVAAEMWGAAALAVGSIASAVATVVTVRSRRKTNKDDLDYRIEVAQQLKPLEGWEKLTASQESYQRHLLVELERVRALLIQARDEIDQTRANLGTAREGEALLHAELLDARAAAGRLQMALDGLSREVDQLRGAEPQGGTAS